MFNLSTESRILVDTDAALDTLLAGLVYHHSALASGYVSRKLAAVVEPYDGRFGRGFRVLTTNYRSTQYCNVAYYVHAD